MAKRAKPKTKLNAIGVVSQLEHVEPPPYPDRLSHAEACDYARRALAATLDGWSDPGLATLRDAIHLGLVRAHEHAARTRAQPASGTREPGHPYRALHDATRALLARYDAWNAARPRAATGWSLRWERVCAERRAQRLVGEVACPPREADDDPADLPTCAEPAGEALYLDDADLGDAEDP